MCGKKVIKKCVYEKNVAIYQRKIAIQTHPKYLTCKNVVVFKICDILVTMVRIVFSHVITVYLKIFMFKKKTSIPCTD